MKIIDSNKIKIGLWRKSPPICQGKSGRAINFVFPSARQAIVAALKLYGLGRHNRVAVPEWSSHCVISAIGMISAPIPLREVIDYDIKVDGVLLYEQWGWPIIENAKAKITERFKDALIILDRVDSADINNKKRIKFYPKNDEFEIISLTKILGLPGGGLLKADGNYKKFKLNTSDVLINQELCKIRNYKKILNLYKNEIEFLYPDLESWLINNDLFGAIRQENISRENNLKIILNNKLSQDWKKWMVSAVENGSRPGIVPFFVGASINKIKKAKEIIEKKFSTESEVYHFNWSGDPLKPDYKKCLAFPANGLVENLEAILKEITRIK